MLSFQLVNENRAIQIDLDREGLEKLILILEKFRTEDSGHAHLRSPSAGGHFLSDKTPWGKDTVGEVIISFGGDD